MSSSAALADAPVRRTVVSYANGGGDQNGYSRASVGLNYKFIRCDNEVHLAYSLDNSSVKVSDTYSYNGKEVLASGFAPTPPTIALSGSVREERSNTTIAEVSDGLAAPALGYGCFSGQTKRVGPVPAGSSAQVDNYLSGLIFSPSDMPQNLRNSAVESAQATADRAELQELAAEKEKAEQAAAKRTEQARLQAAKVQSAKDAKALAAGKGTKERLDLDADAVLDSSRQSSRESADEIPASGGRLPKVAQRTRESASTTRMLNDGSRYVLCVQGVQGTQPQIMSPLYRFDGDFEALTGWTKTNGFEDADHYVSMMYTVLLQKSKTIPVSFAKNSLASCSLEDEETIKNEFDLLKSNRNVIIKVVPWALMDDPSGKSYPPARLLRLVEVSR